MRIIFLDIDGVLNHPGTYCEGAPWRREAGELLPVPVAPECMARLNRLVAETGARIVISSSWRLFARWQDLGPALVRHGLVGEVVGETRRPTSSTTRPGLKRGARARAHRSRTSDSSAGGRSPSGCVYTPR
jgi:hypothetical protein